jgi:hypothetical protein
LILLFLLTACGQPQVIHEPVIAEIPVAVSCNVSPVTAPDWNASHVAQESPATEKLRAVLADMELSKGYVGELEAALRACG